MEPGRPVVTTCGSGVTACVLALGLQLVGRHDVAGLRRVLDRVGRPRGRSRRALADAAPADRPRSHRRPLDPRRGGSGGRGARAGDPAGRPPTPLPDVPPRAPVRRAHARPPAPGADRHLPTGAGARGGGPRQRLPSSPDRLARPGLARVGGVRVAGLAAREPDPPLRGPARGHLRPRGHPGPAGLRPDGDARSARGGAGLRHPRPAPGQRRPLLLRRRSELRGDLPGVHELRRSLPGADRLRVHQQPVGDLGAAVTTDAGEDACAPRARVRLSRDPGGRQRPLGDGRRHPRGGGPRP